MVKHLFISFLLCLQVIKGKLLNIHPSPQQCYPESGGSFPNRSPANRRPFSGLTLLPLDPATKGASSGTRKDRMDTVRSPPFYNSSGGDVRCVESNTVQRGLGLPRRPACIAPREPHARPRLSLLTDNTFFFCNLASVSSIFSKLLVVY